MVFFVFVSSSSPAGVPVAIAEIQRTHRWPAVMWCYSGWSASPASCCGVCVGGDLGGGLLAELDVAAEAAQVQMPGFGLEFGGGASVGGQVDRKSTTLNSSHLGLSY